MERKKNKLNSSNKEFTKESMLNKGSELTCYEFHEASQSSCKNNTCRHWIEHQKSQNCILISAKEGPKTLQQIGDIFGITRMRICQIEKNAISKLVKKRKILK